mmetsp:Transcript_15461/g.58801  ORF Transcript_15461/g.58801 Transcript_15461/m.58801 type:complete len:227 (-) Transcript_15461:388-1068(-)|eukprot:scaffold4719_cov314-Pinguiococcus_pyrenoidosus.AAC.6
MLLFHLRFLVDGLVLGAARVQAEQDEGCQRDEAQAQPEPEPEAERETAVVVVIVRAAARRAQRVAVGALQAATGHLDFAFVLQDTLRADAGAQIVDFPAKHVAHEANFAQHVGLGRRFVGHEGPRAIVPDGVASAARAVLGGRDLEEGRLVGLTAVQRGGLWRHQVGLLTIPKANSRDLRRVHLFEGARLRVVDVRGEPEGVEAVVDRCIVRGGDLAVEADFHAQG